MQSPFKEYQPRLHTPQDVWTTIGLPSRGSRLHDQVREGLAFEYLERISNLLQVPRGVVSNAIGMSPAMIARRAKAGRLNTVESDRLVSVATVFGEALSLFENDLAAATEWMSTPVRGLGSKRPLDMMRTRVETEAVIDLIGRLERVVLV